MAYSDKKKRETLTLLAANGGNVTATAKQAGVDRKTIYNWLKDPVPEAEDIAGAMAVALSLVLPQIPDFTQPGNAHAYPAAIRELVRAYALLTGKATDRVESEATVKEDKTELTLEQLEKMHSESQAVLFSALENHEWDAIFAAMTPDQLEGLLRDYRLALTMTIGQKKANQKERELREAAGLPVPDWLKQQVRTS